MHELALPQHVCDVPTKDTSRVRHAWWYIAFGLSVAISCFGSASISWIASRYLVRERINNSVNRWRFMDNSDDDRGRYFPPRLYPQMIDFRNFTHNKTWYAVSAYMDMRPRAYNDTPTVTIVAGGPLNEVVAGTNWFARLFILRSGAVVTVLECERTKYAPLNQETSNHAAANVVCYTAKDWPLMQSISSENLGVCLTRNRTAYCDVASIVPVGLPPRYPRFPLPWADRHFDANVIMHDNLHAREEQDYRDGSGRIAMCVPAVIGDQYAPTLRFFLAYYRELGVDTAFIYMHSTGHEFARVAEAIVAEQEAGSSDNLARLVLLPWCMQLGASYHCISRQTTIAYPGYDDFVATNHGQILAHQDCLFRSMGTFRWTLFVDLDEYIMPRKLGLLGLHDLARDSVVVNRGVPPAEISIRMAFYESCLPSPNDQNVSVSLSPAIDPSELEKLPRPAWSGARVSVIFGQGISPFRRNQKFMCDPMECDRVAIHYADTKLCDRYPGRASRIRCTDYKERHHVPPDHAIVHQNRVYDRKREISSPRCDQVDGVHELDWSFTNFAIDRLSLAGKRIDVFRE